MKRLGQFIGFFFVFVIMTALLAVLHQSIVYLLGKTGLTWKPFYNELVFFGLVMIGFIALTFRNMLKREKAEKGLKKAKEENEKP